jgi:8-oxo-dGTP pyrophosphatase MutT (NUDIX family)
MLVISCGAVIYGYSSKDQNLKVLLVKSNRNNKWGFPKGHKKIGETDFITANREIYEETGLKKISFIKFYKQEEKYIVIDNQHRIIEKCNIYFIALTSLQTTKPLDKCEILEIKWVTVIEAKYMLDFQSQQVILQRTYNFLRRRI